MYPKVAKPLYHLMNTTHTWLYTDTISNKNHICWTLAHQRSERHTIDHAALLGWMAR